VDGWELTEAGNLVVEHARVIQNAVELATRAVSRQRSDSIVGTVRVTSADGFGTLFIVPAVSRVQSDHPELRVELVTGARELSLRNSNFDIGITLGTPPGSRLFTETLCEYDATFYASESYLSQHGDPRSIEELARHPLIYFVDTLQRIRELQLGSDLSEATVRFSSTNIFAQAEAARQGVGVALLPKFIARTIPTLRPISLDIAPQTVLVTLAVRKDAIDRPEVIAVRNYLHEEVRNRKEELILGR
jgi:DNA-binding transcriptional LysR family regulator